MAQLRRDYQQFEERGTEIVVIANKKAGAFRDYWRKENLPYVGLPDPGKHVFKIYGVEYNIIKLGWMPAHFVVDKEGMIRFAHYGKSMSDIPANKKLLTLLDEIN